MQAHYSPVHHGALTNHLPMYQTSMRTLGFNEETIQNKSSAYIVSKDLKDLTDSQVDLTDFEEAYLRQVDVYRSLLAEGPIDQVIRDFMVDKKEMMASGLFHGLIRLGFAVKEGDLEELAKALSYFHVVAETLTIEAGGGPAAVAKDAWNGLMALRKSMTINFTHGSTMLKADQILGIKDLMDQVTDIEVVEDTEKRMGFIFANWYLKTRDFYVLHVITGYQALLEMKPYLSDFDEWLQSYWRMAQIFSLFTEERLPIIKISVSPWQDVMKEALAMTDVHDIKLFYACKDLYDKYQLKIFNKVAHIVSHKYWGKAH